MADRCIFFDELFSFPNARTRTYSVQEPPGMGMACIDASCRVQGDWYFARKWILLRGGPRLLYRALDRLEAAGFRFRVTAPRNKGPTPAEVAQAQREFKELDGRASGLYADLNEREKAIHRELFPEESHLLNRGYDWDRRAVYKDGAPIGRDGSGRCVERDGGVVYEWVPVPEEFTWRRYPLERIDEALTAPDT